MEVESTDAIKLLIVEEVIAGLASLRNIEPMADEAVYDLTRIGGELCDSWDSFLHRCRGDLKQLKRTDQDMVAAHPRFFAPCRRGVEDIFVVLEFDAYKVARVTFFSDEGEAKAAIGFAVED